MSSSETGLRNGLIACLLGFAFVTACFFYGVGDNLIMLSASSALLIGAIALQGPGMLRGRMKSRNLDVWLAIWVLAVLVASYLFITISPESSFASSWIIACLPLWYLVYSSLVNRRLIRVLLLTTVGLFALISVLRFIFSAQRAHEPLLDPNNYASLLYMLWIPLAGVFLHSIWTGSASRRLVLCGYIISTLLCLAIFATLSRVGTIIVFVALGGWLLLALLRRYPLPPLLGLVGTVMLAYAVCLLRAPGSVATSVDVVELSSGVSIRGALTESTLRMLADSPMGTGIFTFPLLYPLYRLPADQSTAGMFVHNDYLQLLVEAGPWLVAVLLVVAVAVGLRLWDIVRNGNDSSVREFGIGMAILALLAHATMTFEFYVLPIGILFVVLCAEFFSPVTSAVRVPEHSAAAPAEPRSTAGVPAIAGWSAAMALLLVCWAYLALETVTQGIFGGQPTLAMVRDMRQSPAAMLRFARLAQSLNDKRSVPVMGEAMVMAAGAQQTPLSSLEKLEILALYRRARVLDPLNPFVFESFYQFLKTSMDRDLAERLSADESPEVLLQQAIRLDVRRTNNVVELLSVYDRYQQPQQALQLLQLSVFPWLERIQWHNPRAAQQMLEEMRLRAEAAGDTQFLLELDQKAAALAGIRSQPQSTSWFRQWQQSTQHE